MKTYTYFSAVFITVEAESEEQALDKALEAHLKVCAVQEEYDNKLDSKIDVLVEQLELDGESVEEIE